MSDRVCVRGCTVRGEHFANCPAFGRLEHAPLCRGCVPRECREGSLVCDRCFGRMRGLLADAPDLLARLRSLVDPAKAKPTDQQPTGSPSARAEPFDVDVIDAHAVVLDVLATWSAWGSDLRAISNDLAAVEWMGHMLLDRHRPVDGVREAWSVQDAVDRWGVERRVRPPVPFEEDEDGELEAVPIAEWGDPLISREDAAFRVGVTVRTIRRWERREMLAPVATTRGRWNRLTAWFRLSHVLAVWERESIDSASRQD